MNDYKTVVKNRFDELAPTYSSKAFSFIKNKRVKFIRKFIDKNDKILEVGCGSGNLLRSIECDNISGLDISPGMVKEAKKTCPKGEFVVGDAEKLPFNNNSFDKVIISEVLYYLPNLDKAIHEAFRVLKPNGVLLITSLNKKYNFVRTIVNLFKLGVNDKVSMSYISLKKLKNILEKDFKIEEVASIPIKIIPTNYSLIFFIASRKPF